MLRESSDCVGEGYRNLIPPSSPFRGRGGRSQDILCMPAAHAVKVDPSDATPGFAKLHETTIHDDTRNPSLETCVSAKFAKVLEGGDVSRLHGVLGFILGMENPAGEAQRSRIVTPEEFGHGGLVSLFALLDEIDFWFILHSGPFAIGAVTGGGV